MKKRIRNGFHVIKGANYLEVNLPVRQTSHAAGYDIEACEEMIIHPINSPDGGVVMVPTGLKCKMKNNEVLKIYSRSSLGCKRNLMIPNNVGIIDSDYYNNENNEGHIYVPLINFGTAPVIVHKGDRIAQGVLENYKKFKEDKKPMKKRKGGIGSTK